MWPWGHAAVGYLLYTGYTHANDRLPPSGPAAIAVALGTQFPDIVDKPLAWNLGVLPSGRSLAHSLFAAVLVTALVARYANRRGYPRVGLAFGMGYVSHLVTDGIDPLLSGDFSKLTYLGWPLLPTPDYSVEHGFIHHFINMELTPFVFLQFGLVTLVIGVWVRDGTPGLDTLRIGIEYLYEKMTARG